MGLLGRQSSGLQRAIFGTRGSTPAANGSVEECKIHHVDGTGCYFTRPDFDHDKHVFGPAPYAWTTANVTGAAGTGPHTHSVSVPGGAPVSGDRCLVVWAGVVGGQTKPWVVSWWPR
jgi:hypothetical protein